MSAPRFIVKYWKSVYYPLDKDIVRELWVEGDLKDQLGLKHHKARRNRSTSGSALESTPIFNELNNRSLSELENAHDPFNATHRGGGGNSTTLTVYPPMSQVTDSTQYAASGYDPLGASQQSTGSAQDIEEPNVVSPRFSYYSASNLPPVSPLPSPKFPSPPNPNPNPNPTPIPLQKPNVASSAMSRGTPMSTMPMPSQTTAPTLLVPPAMFGRSSPNSEMRARIASQSDSQGPSSWAFDSIAMQRTPSEMSHTSSSSFATAYDFEFDERGSSTQPPMSSVPGYIRQDEDDISTFKELRRKRTSEDSAVTWEGARAM